MFSKIFKRRNKKRKLENLYNDIKYKTIKVKRFNKDKDIDDTPADKEYCKMIKIDDLYKILEYHFGEK